MKKIKTAKEFCVGCGLCQSFFGEKKAILELDENGFYSPDLNLTPREEKILESFCPILKAPEIYDNNIWGIYEKVFLGYSTNEEIRYKASSGGVLTSVCSYLLEEKIVDKIIQIGNSSDSLLPIAVEVNSIDQLKENCGSKYIAVSLLKDVLNTLNKNKNEKFAIVGKPCDIRAIYNLKKVNPEIVNNLKYTFSFFCAGTPSFNATKTLIKKLGLDFEDVNRVTYRGNGWPGYAAVYDKFGNKKSMSYDDSWGKILGRDLCKGCRFCFDGVGEYADISAGDAWYLDNQGNVTFEEAKGRNVIFARTKLGEELLKKIEQNNKILLEDFDIEILKKMQPYQYEKKGILLPKVLAMKTCFRNVPSIELKEIRKYGYVSQRKLRNYLGTIKRILKNKI